MQRAPPDIIALLFRYLGAEPINVIPLALTCRRLYALSDRIEAVYCLHRYFRRPEALWERMIHHCIQGNYVQTFHAVMDVLENPPPTKPALLTFQAACREGKLYMATQLYAYVPRPLLYYGLWEAVKHGHMHRFRSVLTRIPLAREDLIRKCCETRDFESLEKLWGTWIQPDRSSVRIIQKYARQDNAVLCFYRRMTLERDVSNAQ